MKPSGNPFTFANVRFIAAAALLATLAFAPAVGQAASKDVQHVDRTELRINDLHAKLKITAAQEDQWSKVAQVMRDDAKKLDALTQARTEQGKDMTAIDDLQSYSEISDAHAEGIKNLIPPFTALYASMSDAQKTTADKVFGHPGHKHHEQKQADKAPANK